MALALVGGETGASACIRRHQAVALAPAPWDRWGCTIWGCKRNELRGEH